jgi:hypothetical protein
MRQISYKVTNNNDHQVPVKNVGWMKILEPFKATIMPYM